jgi:hypothetical protein
MFSAYAHTYICTHSFMKQSLTFFFSVSCALSRQIQFILTLKEDFRKQTSAPIWTFTFIKNFYKIDFSGSFGIDIVRIKSEYIDIPVLGWYVRCSQIIQLK